MNRRRAASIIWIQKDVPVTPRSAWWWRRAGERPWQQIRASIPFGTWRHYRFVFYRRLPSPGFGLISRDALPAILGSRKVVIFGRLAKMGPHEWMILLALLSVVFRNPRTAWCRFLF